ncbi:hypothetical protein FUA23_18680 [Neolewinella aurantiaca]|uniref:Uncharacterized protein n=1 Tax=Neolewinella aurantiaca TaxID=2602767 RepID=A0A5C7FMC4_9BACT|nr:hypothetical protein [Neolewinella aurantiaca]TXF87119.1 hypothetical protein FUA23_18680 [Neolewinella aurantiaca]
MKILYLVVVLLFGIPAANYTSKILTSHYGEKTAVQPENILLGVEKRISTAMTRSFMRRSLAPLTAIRKEISQVESPEQQQLVTYWLAHTDFQIAVYYLTAKDMKACETVIKRGISLLEGVKNKNSEELALLAYLQGFSIQFSKGLGAAKISKRANANSSNAAKLDAENLRAHYVMGSLNFYTPKAYGGGKKVEEHLTRAISLPANKLGNPYLPGWGKAEAYELLVRHYRNTSREDEAEILLSEGLELFPDNYLLNSLAAKGK